MTVNYEIDGAVGVVTLAKPPHNLLDDALLEDLMTAYEKVVAEGARAILLRSSMRHFCAGAEVQSFGTTTVMAVPKVVRSSVRARPSWTLASAKRADAVCSCAVALASLIS